MGPIFGGMLLSGRKVAELRTRTRHMLAQRVVCAVGFEHWQPTLVRCLAPLKEAGCRELILAHVATADEMLGHVPSLLKEDLRHALAAATSGKLEELAEISRAAGLAARAVIEHGDQVWVAIRELAQREGAALIAVGSAGGLWPGRTAYSLMHGARTPLLIVRSLPQEPRVQPDTACAGWPRRVLYPTDWSPRAQKAQEAIIQLKPAGVSEVIVAHVLDPQAWASGEPVHREQHRAHAEAGLAHTQRTLQAAGLVASTLMLEGSAAHEIVEAARRQDASLIVMGSTGKTVSAERVLGSVSEAVACQTDRSVLLAY